MWDDLAALSDEGDEDSDEFAEPDLDFADISVRETIEAQKYDDLFSADTSYADDDEEAWDFASTADTEVVSDKDDTAILPRMSERASLPVLPPMPQEDMSWLDEIESGIIEEEPVSSAPSSAVDSMLDSLWGDEEAPAPAAGDIDDLRAAFGGLSAADMGEAEEEFALFEAEVGSDADTELDWYQESTSPAQEGESFDFDFSDLASNDIAEFDFEGAMAEIEQAEQEAEPIDFADLLDSQKKEESLFVRKGGTAKLIQDMQTGKFSVDDILSDSDQVEAQPDEAIEDLFSFEDIPLPQTSQFQLSQTDSLFEDEEDEIVEAIKRGTQELKIHEEAEGPRIEMGDDIYSRYAKQPSALGEYLSGTPAATQDEGIPTEDIELAAAQRPDWVKDLRPEAPVSVSAGSLEFKLDQAKLSDMSDAMRALLEKSTSLAQQPTSVVPGIQEPPKAGILAGIVGSLEAPDVVQQTGETAYLGTAVLVSPTQRAHIDILDMALTHIRFQQESRRKSQRGQVILPDEAKLHQRTRPKLDRLVVSILLLLALLIPFFSSASHPDFLNGPSTSLTVHEAAVAQAVAGLQPGQYVLVSFDYGPTVANELNPLAEAVLRDILKQGGIPILTSVSPVGVLNARYLMEDLRHDADLLTSLDRTNPLAPRREFFTLRYISGDAVGVRALARSAVASEFLFEYDSEGEATGLDFDQVDAGDLAFVVVIGESLDDARIWAEQFPVAGLAKYLLTTTAAEPLAQVYVSQAQAYQGYLAGHMATQVYNRQRNPEVVRSAENLDDFNLPDTDVAQWYSLQLAILLTVGVVIVGALFNLLRRMRGRRS
jgi:hypothetical protein